MAWEKDLELGNYHQEQWTTYRDGGASHTNGDFSTLGRQADEAQQATDQRGGGRLVSLSALAALEVSGVALAGSDGSRALGSGDRKDSEGSESSDFQSGEHVWASVVVWVE